MVTALQAAIPDGNSIQQNADSLYGQITLGIIAVHEFWMALILSLPELLHSQDMFFSASRIILGAAVAYMLVKITPLAYFNRVLYFVATQEESSELFKLGVERRGRHGVALPQVCPLSFLQ